MSAFIVDDTTINRILTYLYCTPVGYESSYAHDYFKAAGVPLDSEKNLVALGNALAAMNRTAVNQRYSEQEQVAVFALKLNEKASDVQVLKSLQCFLYQCSEGKVPKTKLYKLMRQFEKVLMSSIISKVTDYEKLEWG